MRFASLGLETKPDFELFDHFFEQWIPMRKEIYIFGAGVFGKAMRNFLHECGIALNAYVVSFPECKSALTGEAIINIDDFKARYNSNIAGCGLIMSISERYYAQILAKLYFAVDDMFFFSDMYKDLILKHCGVRNAIKISWHLTEHCNLSCYSCQIAAPLAEVRYYDLKQYKTELLHLNKVLGDKLEYIGLTAAEPLLHPEFLDFVRYSCEIYPNTRKHIITNGIALYHQKDIFWETLADDNIYLTWTKYPIKYPDDPKVIFKTAERFGVNIEYDLDSFYGNTKESFELLSGSGESSKWDYIFCPFHNSCITIRDGLLFTCHRFLVSELCSRRFNINLPICDQDYLDIFNTENIDDILAFVSKRPVLCGYCRTRENHSIGKWQPSKRSLNEWYSYE